MELQFKLIFNAYFNYSVLKWIFFRKFAINKENAKMSYKIEIIAGRGVRFDVFTHIIGILKYLNYMILKMLKFIELLPFLCGNIKIERLKELEHTEARNI